MKIILKLCLASLVVLVSANATPSKVKSEESINYDFITILDNGVKRKVKVLKTDIPNTSEPALRTYKATTNATTNSGVIVSFKDTNTLSLDEFEKKYNLELKTKMLIGYYIFYNKSSKSDVEIVSEIIQNETNVRTVKPNWKSNMKTY